MVALVDLVEVDELRVRLLRPAPRCLVELSREYAHRSRDGDALPVEESERVLPVETTRGDSGVRHPGHRDVVEDLVPRQVADRMAGEGGRDVLVALRVVIEHPGRQRD